MGRTEHRDPSFLHRFKQGGLCLGRRPVDFIGEDKVSEKWAFLENELATSLRFLKHRISGNVAGKEVRGELDALAFQIQSFGKGLDQFGFSKSR